MRGKHFNLTDPQALKDIAEFKELFNIETDKEAAERLIRDAWTRRLYIKYLLEHRDASNEEPQCLRRIIFEGKFFCCKKAPRVVELPTLDICRACKSKVFLGPIRAEPTPDASLKPQETREAIKDVWCRSGGIYVVRSVCDKCNEPCEKKALFV